MILRCHCYEIFTHILFFFAFILLYSIIRWHFFQGFRFVWEVDCTKKHWKIFDQFFHPRHFIGFSHRSNLDLLRLYDLSAFTPVQFSCETSKQNWLNQFDSYSFWIATFWEEHVSSELADLYDNKVYRWSINWNPPLICRISQTSVWFFLRISYWKFRIISFLFEFLL